MEEHESEGETKCVTEVKRTILEMRKLNITLNKEQQDREWECKRKNV